MIELFFSGAGRVGRATYWSVQLVGGSVMIAFLLTHIFADHPGAYVLYLAFTWPMIMVAIKRYHDRGKSGLWYLIALIPILGTIWQIIELGFLRGVPGPNKYGPDPLMIQPEQPT